MKILHNGLVGLTKKQKKATFLYLVFATVKNSIIFASA